MLTKIISTALEKGGASSVYEIIHSSSYTNSVTLEEGFHLTGHLAQFFSYRIGSQHLPLDHARIMPIDGQIIEISQLHHLLTEAYEQKIPVILIARGFSKEVTNTLAFNYLSQKLTVAKQNIYKV